MWPAALLGRRLGQDEEAELQPTDTLPISASNLAQMKHSCASEQHKSKIEQQASQGGGGGRGGSIQASVGALLHARALNCGISLEGLVNWCETVGSSHLHVSSPPPEAQQLLVLAGDEVDGGILQQGREDEEQTDGHPDVDGFDVGHLERGEATGSLSMLVSFSPWLIQGRSGRRRVSGLAASSAPGSSPPGSSGLPWSTSRAVTTRNLLR